MMRTVGALQVDFQRRTRRVRAAPGSLLLLVGMAMLAAVGAEHAVLQGETADLQQTIAAVRRPGAQDRSGAREDLAARESEVRQANQVLEDLGRPWGALFSHIESAASADVALLSLQSDPSGHDVRMSGEARDFAALSAYVRRLDETPGLADVHLLEHAENTHDPRRPIAFRLTARWVTP